MRNRTTLALALILGLLLSSAAFAGSVAGKATYDDQVPPPGKGPFKALKMDADPACASKHSEPVPTGQLVLGDGNGLANVFVQVKNPPAGDHKAPSDPVVIDQNGCLYSPRVSGAMVGQPVQFRNSDGILHNVHGLPNANREFNLGMPPAVKTSDQTFNKPEPVFPVKCDVHPWMKAYVAVMTHPYFAVTGPDGSFTIDGLADGTYELEAWHEKLGTQTLTVKVGEPAHFSFKVPGK